MDRSLISLNSTTLRGTPLPLLLDYAVAAGLAGVGLWREVYEDRTLADAAALVRASGLRVTSVCRAGMFTAATAAERRTRLTDNYRAVEEAAQLGAESLVVVCGGIVGRDLVGSRQMVEDGLTDLAGHAAVAGVRLAVEPMHPMMVADRSVVTSLAEAADLLETLDARGAMGVGVAVDAYHLWWDVHLDRDLARVAGRVLGVQVSDWVTPINGQLSSRGMPGEGCIDLAGFVAAVWRAGWSGPVEIEVLSDHWWAQSPERVLAAALRGTDAI